MGTLCAAGAALTGRGPAVVRAPGPPPHCPGFQTAFFIHTAQPPRLAFHLAAAARRCWVVVVPQARLSSRGRPAAVMAPAAATSSFRMLDGGVLHSRRQLATLPGHSRTLRSGDLCCRRHCCHCAGGLRWSWRQGRQRHRPACWTALSCAAASARRARRRPSRRACLLLLYADSAELVALLQSHSMLQPFGLAA